MSKPLNITIPNDMHKRLKNKKRFNVSKVCQRAIEMELSQPPIINWYNDDFDPDDPPRMMFDPNHPCGNHTIEPIDIKPNGSELSIFGKCSQCGEHMELSFTFHSWHHWGE